MTIKSYPARKAFVQEWSPSAEVRQAMRAKLDALIEAEKAEAVAPLAETLRNVADVLNVFATEVVEHDMIVPMWVNDLKEHIAIALEGKG